MYCYVWSFLVRPEHVQDFRAAYGPEGDWARLFRRDRNYISTSLLADRSDANRFVTVDFWASHEAWAAFRKMHAAEFESLDRKFEAWTQEETQIGSFDVVGSVAPPASRKSEE